MEWTTANTLTLVGIAIGFALQTLTIVASVAYGWGKISTVLIEMKTSIQDIWQEISSARKENHGVDNRMSVVETRVGIIEGIIERRGVPHREGNS